MRFVVFVVAGLLATGAQAAAGDAKTQSLYRRAHPVSAAAKRWQPGRAWLRGAMCIHRRESTNWHIHNPPYAGGMQFLLSTWVRAGGRASWWISAHPREQLYRAYVIWRANGGSWREWPNTSRACGL